MPDSSLHCFSSPSAPVRAVPRKRPDRPAPGQDSAAQLDAASERYLRLIAEGRNAEAVAAAQEVLALTRQLHGDDSVELASPLTNLATAQLRNGDLRDAEASYQAAISVLERREGFLSPRLANPLVGLGETYVRSEQYPLAAEAYERALRVNHVNEGFYNLDQIKIRDGLTESYLGLQDIDKANFHQQAEIYVQQRKYGKDNPEFVPALIKLGHWYDRTGQPESARDVYESAVRLVEKSDGEKSPAVVDPLIAIAETYRQQALMPPESGFRPVRRDLAAHEQHDSPQSPRDHRRGTAAESSATRADSRGTRGPLHDLGQGKHCV